MSKAYSDPRSKILALSAIVELSTGIALMTMPALVVNLLLAPMTSPMVGTVARLAGMALVALGIACWPGRQASGDAAYRALLAYNAMVAAYLAYLGGGLSGSGWLLWPTVALHAALAGLLLYFRNAPASAQ